MGINNTTEPFHNLLLAGVKASAFYRAMSPIEVTTKTLFMMYLISLSIPALTLDRCKQGKVSRDNYSPKDVIELLVNQEGYTHLGWLNDGINPPALKWEEQYRNSSGSYTIMVSHQFRMLYCVDMGD